MRKYFAREVFYYYSEKQSKGEKCSPLIKVKEALQHSSLKETEKYLTFLLGDTGEAERQIFSNIEKDLF